MSPRRATPNESRDQFASTDDIAEQELAPIDEIRTQLDRRLAEQGVVQLQPNPAPEPAESMPAVEPPPVKRSRKPRAVTGERAAARQKLMASSTRPTNMSIDAVLDARIKLLKDKLHRTQGDLVLMAVDAEIATVKPAQEEIGGSLFEKRPPAVTGIDHSAPVKLFTFRLRDNDYQVLDNLVVERGWPNRKELIVACLEAFCDRHDVPTNPGRSRS